MRIVYNEELEQFDVYYENIKLSSFGSIEEAREFLSYYYAEN